MIRKITPRLIEWQKSDMANVVVMKGAGNALCAGGDVAALALDNQTGREGQERSDAYFAFEYTLDHLIATYKKPYIAFMDGFTMGGGVGLSIHAPFRIATERTVFAMPETTIGFFPDVGASFFLPRLAGAVGTYLALTSDRLTAVNAFYAGVATHYLHSTTLPMLEQRLSELKFRDFQTLEQRLYLVNETIEEYTTGLPHDQPIHLGYELRKAIDRCFSKPTVSGIVQALRNEPAGPTKEWAEKTLQTLHTRSPTSVHVALKQLQSSKEQSWSIADTFRREHQMAAHFMRHPDFVEGVSALLIRRDKVPPAWKPASLEDISLEENIAAPFFKVSAEVAPLVLLTNDDYTEYPHAKFGLPTEMEVYTMMRIKPGYTREQIITAFLALKKDKQGVREVVGEVLDRNTRVSPKATKKVQHIEWIGSELLAKARPAPSLRPKPKTESDVDQADEEDWEKKE